MTPAELPSYALFGQTPETEFAASFHVERVSSRASLHNGIVEPHRHPHLHQLTYWLSGHGQYLLERQQSPIAPGMLCWVPAGRIHGFSVDSGGDAIVISLARDHVDAHLVSMERGQGQQVLHRPCLIPAMPDTANEMAVLFNMADGNYAASEWGSQEAIGAIAALIFITVSRHLTAQGELNFGSMLKGTLFAKLQRRVEQRFKDHPNVTDLAAEIGTTPYLLNKACKAATGLNASDFVRRRILREVERMLLFTVSDLAQIAELTGFSDPSHFTRTFKAFHGETPSAWRARAIKAR